MKRTNIILVFLSILIGVLVATSCSKDHDIPTGKVFNADSGGGSAVDSLTISVTANPSEGGTVTGGGKYQKGKTCVVSASANEGYVFSNWTENGTQVSTSVSYSFTVDADRTLVANFVEQQPNQYLIQVVIDPSAGGTATISGGGTTGSYTYNQQCTVVATLATGYHFLGWYKNGSRVSQELSYTFPVVDSCTLEARFEINTYTITVNASPANGGTVSINSGGTSGTFTHGTTITLRANANPGYTFDRWQDGNTNNPRTITVTAEATYVAHFTYNSIGGHEYVDLGLPSGTLWATCNVGANSPEEYGDYFAWGETQPKNDYSWGTYQYCNGSNNTLTKYCYNSNYGYNGFTDNLTTLLPSDDAATAQWGSGWRMPTKTEWQELLNNTTHIWTTQNGVTGRLFTATNGNSLFLPAAGYRNGTSLDNAGTSGPYWSSSLDTGNPSIAWNLGFGSVGCGVNFGGRYEGFTVRPVRSSRQN